MFYGKLVKNKIAIRVRRGIEIASSQIELFHPFSLLFFFFVHSIQNILYKSIDDLSRLSISSKSRKRRILFSKYFAFSLIVVYQRVTYLYTQRGSIDCTAEINYPCSRGNIRKFVHENGFDTKFAEYFLTTLSTKK